MKKILICLTIVLTFCFQSVSSQAIEVTPSYGYQLGAKLNYGSNYLRFDSGSQAGIVLGFETANQLMAELTYIYQNADVTIRDVVVSPQEAYLAELQAHWIQLGGTRYFRDDNIKPFFGGGLGLTVYSPSNENFDIVNRTFDNETVFSFHFKGGVNFMLSEVIGINLQAALLLPVNWGSFYVGTGGVGVSVSSTAVVGAFSGGLVFHFDR